MVQSILIGIAAGLASALLFISPSSGTALAFPLLALTALPVAIAGLGWGVAGSVLALATGSAIVGLYYASLPALVIYLALFAAPIAWLARLAGLWRETSGGEREWYPLGQLLLHASLATAIGLVIAGWAIGYDPQDLVGEMAAAFSAMLADTSAQPVDDASARAFAELYVSLMPFTLGLVMVVFAVVNLWLAAIVARSSARLERPQQRLWTATLPNIALAVFVIAAALAFTLPGGLGIAASAVAGAFGAAVVLIGLAVLHAVTLGLPGRAFLLGGTYFLIAVSGLPLVVIAIVGAAENFLNFRARKFRGAPPPT